MARREVKHDPGRGVRKAAAYYPERVAEALKEFRHLNTREARAAFADHWIGLWAKEFDDAWPMLYELLEIVEEDELYRDPRRVGPGAAGGRDTHGEVSEYPDFRAYFEDRVKRPFETWEKLEETHRYVATYAPDLFAKSFTVAERAARVPAGKRVNKADNRHPSPGLDIIKTTEGGSDGTSADYWTRRIARDHPSIFERMKAGKFRSVRAAALEAGIAPHTQTVRVDDPLSAARTLRKHMKPDHLRELVRLLAENA
jgi:hypothetical protein